MNLPSSSEAIGRTAMPSSSEAIGRQARTTRRIPVHKVDPQTVKRIARHARIARYAERAMLLATLGTTLWLLVTGASAAMTMWAA